MSKVKSADTPAPVTDDNAPVVTDTEEVEVDASVAAEIAKQLAPALKSMVEDAVKSQVEAAVEKAVESNEAIVSKDAKAPGTTDKGIKDKAVKDKSDYEELGKEKFLLKQILAIKDNDHAELKRLNAQSIATHVKAGYQNETTSADGAYLVPPADFIADVVRLEEQFGVARRNARLYETNSNAVTLNKKAGSVTMYEIGEGVAKTGTKMSFGQTLIPLRKFAAIAAMSDELIQDSPVNVYNELTMDFAREHARIQDTLMFTDATTGIVHSSGINVITVGSSINSLTFDHLNQAVWGIPTTAQSNGKFYLNRTILGLVQRLKDSFGRYLWSVGPNGIVDGTIWGYPYELVEVLPHLAEDGNNKAFIIFGDLSYAYLIMKRGLQLTTLLEGTVHGSDGSTINLAEQDMTALRAVSRMNAKVHFGQAFSVIGTGTVS